MSGYTIKDLETLSGIKAHTIRMWEQRYNFLKPKRSCTNIRYYNNEELKTLLNIALLNKYGFKISHIDRMKPDEICEKVLSLRECCAVQDRIINEMVKEMIDLGTDRFENIIHKYIKAHGIENAIKEIIFPFLERIGILWQTGNIMPAQEHFVSNIIRQKLLVAIDQLGCSKGERICLLFLPEGEYHELGLLFLYYLLKSRGFRVVYLGANVPMKDIESICNTMKPEMAYTHLTGSCQPSYFEKLLVQINSQLPGIHTIISGYPTREFEGQPPADIELKRSFDEVMEHLEAL